MQLPESRVEDIPEENDQIQRIVESVDLGAALETLSPGHRKVILLKYAEGLTSAEIAAVMDRAPGTVRRLLSEAYNQLRLVLGEA